jgi:adenylate kinase family enzyme
MGREGVIILEKVRTIHIFGASGSGSTTLARAIADRFGYHHIDTDDALWVETDPPFTVKRTPEECKALIERQLADHECNVISGEFLGWGDFLKGKIDLFIYMHLPVEIRIERIQNREIKRFGSRVMPGGDMHEAHLSFLEWVREYENGDETRRSVAMHKKWLKTADRPVLKIERPESIEELLNQVKPFLNLK